jgi:hypothetical protein
MPFLRGKKKETKQLRLDVSRWMDQSAVSRIYLDTGCDLIGGACGAGVAGVTQPCGN